MEQEGQGVIVILSENRAKVDLLKRLKSLDAAAEQSEDESSDDSSDPVELKTYGIGAQILLELGVRRMEVMSAPMHMSGIAGFGLEVTGYRQE